MSERDDRDDWGDDADTYAPCESTPEERRAWIHAYLNEFLTMSGLSDAA